MIDYKALHRRVLAGGMVRRVAVLATVLLMAGLQPVNAQMFDFFDTCSTGQVLYYTINDDQVTVTVTHPSYLNWGGYDKPVGELSIPPAVEYENVTFTVTAIDASAFATCNRLTSVVVPGTVVEIGDQAFVRCDSLEVFRMGNGVARLERGILANCPRLQYLSVGAGNSVYDSREGCNAIIETATNTLLVGSMNTVIPSSVRVVGEKAFEGNVLLQHVVVPDSVTEVGNRAFAGCTNLESVVLPTALSTMGQQLFSGCVGLTTANLPETLTTVPVGTFEGCSALTSVAIPASVTVIGDMAFCSCAALSQVTLPAGLLTVGDHAFSDCRSLRTVVVPDQVTTIGTDAFWNCEKLHYVKLGSSVRSIGRTAFSRCHRLAQVMSSNPEPPTMAEDSFYEVKDTIPIYIPYNTRMFYEAEWSYFSNFVEADVTAIEEVVTDGGMTVSVTAGVLMLSGAEGKTVRLYDMAGRLLSTVVSATTEQILHVPAAGVYLLQVGTAPMRKVVMAR